jgi:N-acetylglucosaminyldiphosphoundecaprenol N-acetyl-beta-D-mannosaminyltransferase
MSKKIEILDIYIDTPTIEEAMDRVQEYLNDTDMHAIEEISTEMVVKAEENETVKHVIEELDFAVVNEPALLKAAKLSGALPIEGDSEEDFFQRFMDFLSVGERTVYLLGKKEKDVDRLKEFFQDHYPKLHFVGELPLEYYELSRDSLVNEINAITPDVIFSVLPTPEQELFLGEYKDKLNAKIWYGLGENSDDVPGGSVVKRFTNRLIQRGKLQSLLSRYEDEE